jgi:multicomponent Na+:H+ antiporter subunit E
VPGAARFAPLFLWESLRGGIDVAARVMGPRVAVRPGFLVYPSRLTDPGARVFLANCVSLLPGTLAADLEGHRLEVHVLDTEGSAARDLARLEAAVGALFRDPGASP